MTADEVDVAKAAFYRRLEVARNPCRVYWGSHGCQLPRGHAGPHVCDCCTCEDHEKNKGIGHDEDGEFLCPAKPPYYGPETQFYGEDAPTEDATSSKT